MRFEVIGEYMYVHRKWYKIAIILCTHTHNISFLAYCKNSKRNLLENTGIRMGLLYSGSHV